MPATALEWIEYTDRLVGEDSPDYDDTLNVPLKHVVTASGLAVDDPFPGFATRATVDPTAGQFYQAPGTDPTDAAWVTMVTAMISDLTSASTGITKVGTINTGVWQGTSISTTYTDAKVKTVTGTSNRLTIGGTAGDPTFDISATYVGQATITTLGTVTTGVWQGTAVGASYGGTGVNNGASTITIGGPVVFSGAHTVTVTVTADTSITLPTTGTLVNSAVATLSSLTSVGALNSGSITSGFGAIDVGADPISGGALTGTTGAFSGDVNIAGLVGLAGTASAANSVIKYAKTFAVSSGPYYGINSGMNFAATSGAFGGYAIGMVAHAAVDSTNNQNWGGDSVHVPLVAVYGQCDTESGSTGTILEAASFNAIGSFVGATVTKWSGLRIHTPVQSGGTLTNAYGIYIDTISGGVTLNYAIYSAGGGVFFGGPTTVDNTLLATGVFTQQTDTDGQVAGIRGRNASTGTNAFYRVEIGNSGSANAFTVDVLGTNYVGAVGSALETVIFNQANGALKLGGFGTLGVTIGSGGAVTFAATTAHSGLSTFNAGATVASGQTLTLTGATITGAGSFSAGTITATFVGALTGNVTGNASGTAATVTSATQAAITTLANLTTTGALDSGSITSGFGSINVGADAITGGAFTGTTLTLSSGATLSLGTWSGTGVQTSFTLDSINGSSRGTYIAFNQNTTNQGLVGVSGTWLGSTASDFGIYATNAAVIYAGTHLGATFTFASGSIVNTVVTGNITTAAPSGGTAAPWKFGTVAVVSPTLPNRTIELDVNGTIYYLAAKTTNN